MRRIKAMMAARWQRTTPGEITLLVVAMLLSLLGWFFVAVAGATRHEDYLEMEQRWMLAFRDPGNLELPAGPWWLAELARDLSALGGATVVVLLSVLTAIYLLLRGRWRRVILLLVTVAGGYGLSVTLKSNYDRPRPTIVPHLTEVSSASFPSGHSLSSSVVYLTIGALLAQAAQRKREKLFFMSSALFLTLLIGISRVFLGVHYPTDVLAGWAAGTAWAVACWTIAWRLRKGIGPGAMKNS